MTCSLSIWAHKSYTKCGKISKIISNMNKEELKPLIEYINWSELVEDFNLKTGDLDYSEFNKLEIILANYIKINK